MQVETEGVRTACSDAGERSAQRWLTILGILLLVLSGFSAGAEPNTKNVLIVFSALQPNHETLDLMKSGVRAHFSGPVNFSVAYLDYQRLGQESYRESLAATLGLGYSEAKPDVLIVASIEALQFMTQYRDKIFPGVPIVFTDVSPIAMRGLKLLPKMTGLTITVHLRETIDLALRLHPDANAIAVFQAKPTFWLDATHAELLRHQDKVREIDVIDLRAPKCLRELPRSLPIQWPYFSFGRRVRASRQSEPTMSSARFTANADLFRVGQPMSELWVHRRSVP